MTQARSRWGSHRSRFSSRARRGRGVSDVVATILLLALTVTLFASIFAFVTSFPAPPAQNNNQFQASLTYTSNLTYVTSLRILHLAGPAVPGNGFVYLRSANEPSAPEFQPAYSVASGLTGTTSWNLGQTWNLTFASTQRPSARDNITVYIVSGSNLLYSVILPGTPIAPPPTVVATWISPALPVVNQGFTVYATLAGSYAANSVFVNLAAVPGGPTTPQQMTANAQGQWTYPLSTGASSNGTFYGFVNATGLSAGQKATGAVVITISNTGGGSSNGPLSVGVLLLPAPPNSGVTESVQAVVSYTGTSSNLALSVSFSGTSSPSGYTFSGVGPSGLTISGPASETVVSQSTWTIPAPNSLYTYTVSATATVGSLTPVTGTTTFEPALLTASAASGLVGASLTATGSAWSTVSGSTVTLSFGGVAVTPSACSSGTLSGSTITPASGGGFTCTIAVPNGVPTGATNIVATDALSGQVDSYAFTVTTPTLTVGPASGLMGSTATARGAGFAASSTVKLTFDGIAITPSGTSNSTCTFSGSTITTTSTGTFVCQFTIPNGAAAGTATSIASGIAYSSLTATATSTVTAWTLTIGPSSGLIASSATARGAGFAASSTLTLTFEGITITPSGSTNSTCTFSGSTITATSTGTFVCNFAIPNSASAGAATSLASGITYTSQVASATSTVTAWSISLSPTTLPHGNSQIVWVNGTGFAASSILSIILNGTVLTPTSGVSGCTLTGSTITASTSGTFTCKFTMAKAGAAAVYTFTVNDYTSGQTASAYFSRT